MLKNNLEMKQFDSNEFMMIDIVLVGTFKPVNFRPIPAIFEITGHIFQLKHYFS